MYILGEDMRLLRLSNGSVYGYWCVHYLHWIFSSYGELHYDQKEKTMIVFGPTPRLSLRHERTSVSRKCNYSLVAYLLLFS